MNDYHPNSRKDCSKMDKFSSKNLRSSSLFHPTKYLVNDSILKVMSSFLNNIGQFFIFISYVKDNHTTNINQHSSFSQYILDNKDELTDSGIAEIVKEMIN
ncbi:hypothetical protein [Methanobrevibacter sp.]|uniref:hypothetical protein n=1 Tax=Methanobrevibacter sp. TaxID=66852 RepID=UPI0025FDB295|nr:hypothetical protein [Methanobrevibacter sp.]MBQ2832940.1 hypothetical protein [Methanobrevibacter sp.]